MASLTEFAANALLDGTPLPTLLYVDLHLGDPTDAGTANLAAGTSRQLVTRSAAVAAVAVNDNQPIWVPYTDSETITHVSLWDDIDAGEGNCWLVGVLAAPKVVMINDAVYFEPGAITFEMGTY